MGRRPEIAAPDRQVRPRTRRRAQNLPEPVPSDRTDWFLFTTEDTEDTEGIAAGIGWHPSGMRMGLGRWPGGIVASLLNHRLMAVNPPGWSRLFWGERDPDGVAIG